MSPLALLRSCSWPGGCAALVVRGRCPAHPHDRSHQRLYDRRWQRARRRFLRQAENYFCGVCAAEGIVTPATIVDHRIPHHGDERLFWDNTNWRALCKSHHDRKTATQDGGFGR